MTNADELKAVLFGELLQRGLIPGDDDYLGARQEVAERGQAGWNSIRSLVDDHIWEAANRCLGRPYGLDEPERMIGFGWLLTRFLTAPVGLAAEIDARTTELGGLANFIVAVYDQFVDSGLPGPDLLPVQALDGLRAHPAPPRRPLVHPAAEVLRPLVSAYFERLLLMPYSSDHSGIRSTIDRAIHRMYEAENALSRTGRDAPSALLRRKVGLPFVVQGFPAWLGRSDIDGSICAWHLAWTYRVGLFIGWLDDAMDVDEDAASGAANLVARSLQGGADIASIAASVATRGSRCLREWDAHVPAGRVRDSTARDGLAATVFSWLGATRWS